MRTTPETLSPEDGILHGRTMSVGSVRSAILDPVVGLFRICPLTLQCKAQGSGRQDLAVRVAVDAWWCSWVLVGRACSR